MTMSNHNLAIDSIGTHHGRDFTESLACFIENSLASCLRSIRNQHNGSIQRAGVDRLNHVAKNKRGPTCFTLRFGMRDKIVEVSQVCCHQNLVRSYESPAAHLQLSFNVCHNLS